MSTTTLPADIHIGAMADPTPWNQSRPPYRLPNPCRILDVRTGKDVIAITGIMVLVDAGDKNGERWLTAAWFKWPNTMFL